MQAEEYDEEADYDSARDRGLVIVRKGPLNVVEPTHVPRDIRDVINSTITMANVEAQIESERMKQFVMEFKEKYPDKEIECSERILFAIEAEQTNSLIGSIFGTKPDVRLQMSKESRPHYKVGE